MTLGVTLTATGVDVAVFSHNATAIEFCLFDAAGDGELRRIALPERSGDIFHGHIEGVTAGARYGLRAHGPYQPDAGHRFNPSKLLLDPYAIALDRQLRFDPSMRGSVGKDEGIDHTDSAPAMAKCVVTAPLAGLRPGILTPWCNTVLYELHVRGFTMRHSAIPEALRGSFAALAHPASLAHLTRLGVTSIEILPPAAWIEEPHLARLGLGNYWGYNPVCLMAPDPRLAPGGWPEIRGTIAALASAGIETIIDVVLNHTGEGDALGPTLCLRGLDNASYYALQPNALNVDIDDSGCGNTLALDRPHVVRLAMDALRVWATLGGAQGFRFDLATTMGRRRDGFDPAAPLLTAIAQDPVLRELKLIAEPWDIGPGGYQLGRFPSGWGEWNDRFRDDIRRFWRGDGGMRGALATRMAGSSDLFAGKSRPSRGVNFITAHDGFTLADLVAYERKHNAGNGEDNRDGTDANNSWNNGVEGDTGDAAILAARRADQKCLLATLLLARGTPMLAMGAEFGHSQGGNNNAYAQDNAVAWLDWARVDADLLAWTAELIALRQAHPALHDDRLLGDADVAWHGADGQELRGDAWQAWPDDVLVAVLTHRIGAMLVTDRVALAINRGREGVAVPVPEAARGWRIAAASGEAALQDGVLRLPGRAFVVLDVLGSQVSQNIDAAVRLDALAGAAGIGATWWEVDGTRHVVSDDTKRALLAGMGLDASSDLRVRETMAMLAETRDRRAVPHAITLAPDGPHEISLPLSAGFVPRPVWLTVAREDGERIRLRAGAQDGRVGARWTIPLPRLPVGRHLVWREDAPEQVCHLTVAPGRCYRPPELGRCFGLSAQLYSVRRAGDQGIGDFTTLVELGRLGGAEGARLIGLNPLHALFAGDRSRASPYHPSDRRFLDPILLDVTALDSSGTARLTQGLVAQAAGRFQALSALDNVDYPGVWAAKKPVLEEFFVEFEAFARRHPEAEPARAFAAFIGEGGAALRDFVTFEAIAERHPGMGWQDWPVALRTPSGSAIGGFAATHALRLRYHAFLQFLCERQLGGAARVAREGGLAFGFLRDLAVGAAPDGAEAWGNAGLLASGVSIGAPPDPFAPQGQIWALPPPHPIAMAETGFAAFAALLRANMRHAGALRIDHVMGLARLFWVPDGGKGADGAYVSYPRGDLLGQVALESQRAQCLVVGEDLGTVPEGFREALSAADILSFRVMLLEREGIGFRPSSQYPAKALACVSTHDLPTLAGWWEGADITERAVLGLMPAEAAEAALGLRRAERGQLGGADAEALPAEAAVGAHRLVAETPSLLALVQVEDLAGERRSVNLPGTDRERPNWRRKLGPEVGALMQGETARGILRVMRDGRGGLSGDEEGVVAGGH